MKGYLELKTTVIVTVIKFRPIHFPYKITTCLTFDYLSTWTIAQWNQTLPIISQCNEQFFVKKTQTYNGYFVTSPNLTVSWHNKITLITQFEIRKIILDPTLNLLLLKIEISSTLTLLLSLLWISSNFKIDLMTTSTIL